MWLGGFGPLHLASGFFLIIGRVCLPSFLSFRAGISFPCLSFPILNRISRAEARDESANEIMRVRAQFFYDNVFNEMPYGCLLAY